MKNTLALVLMVFGLVGCATATDGKFVSPFASQSSHKDPHWFGEKIEGQLQDLQDHHDSISRKNEKIQAELGDDWLKEKH